MLLDLSRMREPRDQVARTYAPEAFADLANEFRVAAPVSLAFDVLKDRDEYRLVGGVRTRLDLTCSRCLESFPWPIDVSFDLRYLPASANAGEGEREVEEDDLTTAFYRDDTIDLRQLLAEQFYLALPMKPLCDEQCRGLCPVCGTNRNQAACDCRQEWEDPRLAGLKAFLKPPPQS
jgi:uncharacterized protein